MKVISVVEYNVRTGCAEEFIAAFDAPGGISPGVNFQRLIQVTDTRFIGISEMDDIEIAVNKEGPGIDWLDRHEHLLETTKTAVEQILAPELWCIATIRTA